MFLGGCRFFAAASAGVLEKNLRKERLALGR